MYRGLVTGSLSDLNQARCHYFSKFDALEKSYESGGLYYHWFGGDREHWAIPIAINVRGISRPYLQQAGQLSGLREKSGNFSTACDNLQSWKAGLRCAHDQQAQSVPARAQHRAISAATPAQEKRPSFPSLSSSASSSGPNPRTQQIEAVEEQDSGFESVLTPLTNGEPEIEASQQTQPEADQNGESSMFIADHYATNGDTSDRIRHLFNNAIPFEACMAR